MVLEYEQMPHQPQQSGVKTLAVLTLFGSCLLGPGCSQQDLSQYRPAGKHDGSSKTEPAGEVAKTSDETIASGASEEPHSEPSAPVAAPSVTVTENAKAPSVSMEDVSASALVPVNVVDGANVRSLLSIPSVELKSSTSPNAIEPTAAIVDVAKSVAEPRRVEVLVKEKSFRTDQKLSGLRVSFDDLDLLKVLNMEPVMANATELMPAWLKGLDGKRICIRGFMYPTYDTEGIEQFVLARDNQICCFGRDPKIYDLIQVDMKSGKTTNYIPATRSFDVVGTFHVDMKADEDGKPYGLYVIDNAAVIDR
ncbi:hypothetical protein [Schlesneria paludicola]|uniref:hypothetical protein n=1 Tax=Schlesneria paludicola TaxID=360056 RepID=UPI00029A8E55|nr:hypothetical protein [Schlesneria paludicola]